MNGRQSDWQTGETVLHPLPSDDGIEKKFINGGWDEGTKLELRYIPNKLPLVVIKESGGSGPSSTFSS